MDWVQVTFKFGLKILISFKWLINLLTYSEFKNHSPEKDPH